MGYYSDNLPTPFIPRQPLLLQHWPLGHVLVSNLTKSQRQDCDNFPQSWYSTKTHYLLLLLHSLKRTDSCRGHRWKFLKLAAYTTWVLLYRKITHFHHCFPLNRSYHVVYFLSMKGYPPTLTWTTAQEYCTTLCFSTSSSAHHPAKCVDRRYIVHYTYWAFVSQTLTNIGQSYNASKQKCNQSLHLYTSLFHTLPWLVVDIPVKVAKLFCFPFLMDLRYHADMCEIRKCTKFEEKFIGMFIINKGVFQGQYVAGGNPCSYFSIILWIPSVLGIRREWTMAPVQTKL